MALMRPGVRWLEARHGAPEGYDGRQLRPHWIYETCGLQGDAVVAFVGSCEVRGEDLVDLADRRDGLFITADRMLHIIGEFFEPRLDRAVMLQRFLVMTAQELIARDAGVVARRNGDDLFIDEGKLSVSIATVSPVSNLVHFGINVDSAGTPVQTSCLNDLKLEPERFGRDLIERFADDLDRMRGAMTKVRPVT